MSIAHGIIYKSCATCLYYKIDAKGSCCTAETRCITLPPPGYEVIDNWKSNMIVNEEIYGV